MLTLVVGSSSTEVKLDQLKEIFVPLPEGNDFDLVLERLHILRDEVTQLRNALETKNSELTTMMVGLYDSPATR